MNRYPYPVLSEGNSSYKDEFVFEITYIRSITIQDVISFEFNVKMNSEYIKGLMNQGNAKAFIKMQSGIYSEIYSIVTIDGNVTVDVKLSNIQSNDTLKFVGYIIVNSPFEYTYNQELLDIYDSDVKIMLKSKDLLAISNEESLSYNTNNSDFIKFAVSEEQNGKGFSISYETNYINVRIGPEFNVAYGIVKNNKKEICSVFDSHLVFEVFTYVLMDLVQRFDELSEEAWYKLFEQIFLQTGEYKRFEDFIADVKDGNCIELQDIYSMAHKMINNQIENTIISLSKLEEV